MVTIVAAAALEGRPVISSGHQPAGGDDMLRDAAAIPASFMTARARTAPVSAPHPPENTVRKLPPSLWEVIKYRHDGRYTRVNWPNVHWLTAQRIIPILRPAQICHIAAGDLSEAGLNKITGGARDHRRGIRHTVTRAVLYPFLLLILSVL